MVWRENEFADEAAGAGDCERTGAGRWSGEGIVDGAGGRDDAYWKAAIINVLQPWGEEVEVATALRPYLKDSDALVRDCATRALADDVETTRQQLDDPVRAVRVTAAWVLRAELGSRSTAAGNCRGRSRSMRTNRAVNCRWASFWQGRKLAKALEHYRKAASWDPGSAPIHHDLAVVLSGLSQEKEAVEELRKAVQLEPTDAGYHFSLALALSGAGDLEGAISEFREAVRLVPKDVDALRNLGLALAQKDNLRGAEEALHQAEEIAPDDAVGGLACRCGQDLGLVGRRVIHLEAAVGVESDGQDAGMLLPGRGAIAAKYC